MLHRAGIKHLILERGDSVEFHGGASIGLRPSALRILDQLGCYEDVTSLGVPMNSVALRRSDGRVFQLFRGVGKSKQRFGYATQFFERSELLQVIYKRLPDKLSLLLSRGVVDIVSKPNGVSVITDKGEVHHADIIIGADGVRSLTRRTIWDNLGRDEPQVVANERAGKSKLVHSTQYSLFINCLQP